MQNCLVVAFQGLITEWITQSKKKKKKNTKPAARPPCKIEFKFTSETWAHHGAVFSPPIPGHYLRPLPATFGYHWPIHLVCYFRPISGLSGRFREETMSEVVPSYQPPGQAGLDEKKTVGLLSPCVQFAVLVVELTITVTGARKSEICLRN